MTETYRHFEHVHHQYMAGPHWYLALLGVSPGAPLPPVLRRADQERLPCYLETLVSDYVPSVLNKPAKAGARRALPGLGSVPRRQRSGAITRARSAAPAPGR